MDTQLSDAQVPAVGAPAGTGVVVNYLIIAFVFLIAGIAIGALGISRLVDSNKLLIQQAVGTAVAVQNDTFTESMTQLLAEQGSGQAVAARDPSVPIVVDTEGDPALGPEDAPILMVEFSDFRCQYCGRFQSETLDRIMEQYDGLIRFVYRDFPILGQNSVGAALAAECADDQGKFWEYHDLLFANQSRLENAVFIELAGTLELDMDQFNTCLTEQTHMDEINADYQAARDAGANGTPAFVINGQFVSGAQPFENFARIIDAALLAVESDDSEG